MNVILASVGTDGDIFPYVGIGAALRDRGHDVTLLASEHYESLATSHGFAFHPIFGTRSRPRNCQPDGAYSFFVDSMI